MCLNTHKDSCDYYLFTENGGSYGITHPVRQDPDLATPFQCKPCLNPLKNIQFSNQKLLNQQLKAKSTCHIISRRKGVCSG